jgi:hypothetical protein
MYSRPETDRTVPRFRCSAQYGLPGSDLSEQKRKSLLRGSPIGQQHSITRPPVFNGATDIAAVARAIGINGVTLESGGSVGPFTRTTARRAKSESRMIGEGRDGRSRR